MSKLVDKRKAALDRMMKNAIYEATVKVVAEHGLDGMKMERVAEAAGVAKGTLYNYFSDKTALIVYVCQRIFEPLFEKMAELASGDMQPEKKLECIAGEIFGKISENVGLLSILSEYRAHEINHIEQHRNKVLEGIKMIAPVIAEGVSKGRFRKVDPIRAAAMFIGAIYQFIQATIEINNSRPTKEDATEFTRIFFQGLMIRPKRKET